MLCIGLSVSVQGGQSNPKAKREEPGSTAKKAADEGDDHAAERQRAKLRDRSLDLIKDAGEAAARLDDRRIAARIQASAADVLWPYDLNSARHFFLASFESSLALYRGEKDMLQDPIVVLTSESSADLCQEMIQRTSVRDSALAKQMAESFEAERQSRKAASKARSIPRSSNDWRNLQDNQLATSRSMLLKDQQAAIKDAQRIFADGIPMQGLLFLWELSMRDRAAADRLFLWMLAGICQSEEADARELQFLANYVYPTQFIFDSFASRLEPPKRPRDTGSEEMLIQWYIEASFITLSRIATSDLARFQDASLRLESAVYLATWLEPRVAETRPELNRAWRSIIDQLSARLAPRQQNLLAMKLTQEKKLQSEWDSKVPALKDPPDRIQQLVARAERTRESAERDQFYQQAALDADQIGDLSWALQIAANISDEEFRGQVQDWIYFNQVTRALAKKDLPGARSYALAIKAPDQAADLLCVMARSALKEKDKPGAFDLLAEAEAQASKAGNTPAKVRALIIVGNELVNLDADHALQTMASTVEAANRVPDYGPERRQKVRALGNSAGRRHLLNRNKPMVELETVMAALAAVDFDGALSLAQSLENAPLKLTSVIAVASSALDQKRQVSAPAKESIK
jgi:hypothetical protein